MLLRSACSQDVYIKTQYVSILCGSVCSQMLFQRNIRCINAFAMVVTVSRRCRYSAMIVIIFKY